jgi:hypothetical protein
MDLKERLLSLYLPVLGKIRLFFLQNEISFYCRAEHDFDIRFKMVLFGASSAQR